MSVYSSKAKKIIFAAIAFALVLSGCGGGGGGSAPPAVTLQSIAVTPQNQTPALNSRLQLTATGTYSDSSTQNITATVIWSSSNTAVATVGATSGLVTPVVGAAASQSTVITATSGALTGTTTITLAAIPTFTLDTVTEPLALQQWGLRNTGQNGYADTTGVANTGTLGTDINVDSVYNTYGYTGWGVTVAVIDSGLEIAHEDLSANVVTGGSWNFINNTTNPTSSSTTGDHGTSVSGLIAMAKNGIGGIGVAPNVQLKGFNYLGGTATQTLPNALVSLGGSTSSPNSSDVAIFNQSFGTQNTVDFTLPTDVENQYAAGTTSLRGGKGAVYVKSAGNGFINFAFDSNNVQIDGCIYSDGGSSVGLSCQNANFDPSNTLPYNIVIAALNANGIKSSYSTAGSAIWASAPGGEYGKNASVASGSGVSFDPAMVTTDQSNCVTGYSVTTSSSSLFNRGGTNLSSVNSGCNYTNSFNGTSSAAPMTAGAIALILEANPALTWREVKDILARTAVQVDTAIAPVSINLTNGGAYVAEQGWITNAAGHKFHNWYGFGALDVSAAVAMASTYTSGSLGSFASTAWVSSSPSVVIADNSTTGVSVPLTVPTVGTSGIVETVQIKLSTTATGGCTGDIGIELTSPSLTKSILKNIRDGFTSNNLVGMVLASNAFYGESSAGNWAVKVVDGWGGCGNQTLTNVQIRVYGH